MQMHSARDILTLTRKDAGGEREEGTKEGGGDAISITASRACLQEGRQFSGKIILLSDTDPLQHEPLPEETLHRAPIGETTTNLIHHIFPSFFLFRPISDFSSLLQGLFLPGCLKYMSSVSLFLFRRSL